MPYLFEDSIFYGILPKNTIANAICTNIDMKASTMLTFSKITLNFTNLAI